MKMLNKYRESKVNNNALVINNDPELVNFQFLDAYQLKKVVVDQCEHVVFEKPSTFVQIFTLTNSKLNNITGIYVMAQIIELNLCNNNIRDISELSDLKNL